MFIFLDIDGVMVPAKGWQSPELLNDGFPAFSNKATRVLQSLISEDATIMLTTSHKSNQTLDEWKAIFNKRGINVEIIESLGNNVDNLSRKDEIIKWFNINNNINEFVIIDDDKSLNSLPDNLKKNLVLTNPMVGLSDEHLENIKAIRKKELQFT